MSVSIAHDGPVTTIILDRPQARNAVDHLTATALMEAFTAFEADNAARAAVLWGAGGCFCAGADLREIAEGRPNRLEAEGPAPLGPSRMALTKPLIAAISGHAVAGGLELALLADLRVAEEDAVLGVFCRRWGVPLIDGGTARLPRLIGLSRALDLILSGRAVMADEALAMGLVNRVVPRGRSRPEAEALAHQLAAFPQDALRADLASAKAAFDAPLPEAIAAEFARGLPAVRSGAEGAAEFVARRRQP